LATGGLAFGAFATGGDLSEAGLASAVWSRLPASKRRRSMANLDATIG
jgi:hypothetical protein